MSNTNLKNKIVSAITAATMAITAFSTVLPISLALTSDTQITASAANNVTVKAAGIKYYNAVSNAVRVELDNTGADVYKVWLCGDTSFAANKTRYVRLERKTGTRFDNLASTGGTYYIRTQACKRVNGRWYYSSSVTTKISLNNSVKDTGIKFYNAADSAVRVELDRTDATVYKVWLCGDTSFAANKTRYVRLEGNTNTTARFDRLANKGGTYYIRTQACKSYNGKWSYSAPYTTKIQLNTGVDNVAVKSYTSTENSVKINLDRTDATIYKVWLCGDTSFAANKTRYIRLEGNTNTSVSFNNLANKGGTYYVKTQACKSYNGQWKYSSAVIQIVRLKSSDQPVINPTQPTKPSESATTTKPTTTKPTTTKPTTTKPTTTKPTTTKPTTTKPTTTKPSQTTTKPTSPKTVGIISLNSVQRDSSSATIKFDPATNSTGCRIWVCKKYNANNTPMYPVILSNYAGETSFTITDLEPNTTYYYWIRPFMFYYPDGVQTTEWGVSYYNCFTTTDLGSSYEVPIEVQYDNETQTAKKLITLWASTIPSEEDFETAIYGNGFRARWIAQEWVDEMETLINNRLSKSEVAEIVANGTTWAKIDEFYTPTEVTQSTKYFNADGTWKEGVVREHANVTDQTRAWIAENITGKDLTDREKVQLINEYTCQLLAPMMEMYADDFDLYFSSTTGNKTKSPTATGRQEELDSLTKQIFREIKSIERIPGQPLYIFYYDNYDEDGYNDYPSAGTRPIYGLIFASICYEAGVDVYDPGLSSANKMTNVFFIEENGIRYYTSPLLNQYSKLGKYGGTDINSYTNVAEGTEAFTQMVAEYNNLVQYTVTRWDEKVAADPSLPTKAGSTADISPLREWVTKQ